MTKQEIFTKVVTHLRAQGKKAKVGRHCVYWAPDGSTCAVGCLIPDELYDPVIEGSNPKGALQPGTRSQNPDGLPLPANNRLLREVLLAAGFVPEQADFLRGLQDIHDYYPADEWEYAFQRFARAESLVVP